MSKYKRINLDGKSISTWEGFHDEFSEKLGFPEFYGRNMNAWADCLISIKNPEDRMTKIHLEDDQFLLISIEQANHITENNPDILRLLNECCAFLNHHFLYDYGSPIIVLAYDMK